MLMHMVDIGNMMDMMLDMMDMADMVNMKNGGQNFVCPKKEFQPKNVFSNFFFSPKQNFWLSNKNSGQKNVPARQQKMLGNKYLREKHFFLEKHFSFFKEIFFRLKRKNCTRQQQNVHEVKNVQPHFFLLLSLHILE